MNAIRRWAPIVSGLVLVLRTLGLQELADLIDQSGADVVSAVVLLAGVALKLWSMYQRAKAAKDTVAPR